MKKETIIAILATVVGVFIALLVIGLIENKKERESLTSVDNSNAQEIQGNMRTDFIEGCSEEVSAGICTCMYDTLENKYGIDGIADMTADYLKTGEVGDKYLNTAMSCIK